VSIAVLLFVVVASTAPPRGMTQRLFVNLNLILQCIFPPICSQQQIEMRQPDYQTILPIDF
jgi:hypothetical protein